MDIKNLAASTTADITLLHPVTGEPIPNDGPADTGDNVAKIKIFGPGSKEHQAATTARNQRIFDRIGANSGPGKKKQKLSAEEQAREQAIYLAACTHSINFTHDGNNDAKAIESLYADTSVGWVADQVAAALGDWGSFLPEQSAS